MKKLLLLVALFSLSYGAHAQITSKASTSTTISQAPAASNNGYARISYKPDLEAVFVMLSSGGTAEQADIRVLKPNGTLVVNETTEVNHLFLDYELNVAHLPEGLYYLTVNSTSLQYATSFTIVE